MKRRSLLFVVAVVCLGALSAVAKAQTVDQVLVNIPFEFVVAGKVLPAGTYHGTRRSVDPKAGLLLTSPETGGTAIVLPVIVESVRPDKPQLSFQEVDGQRFLTRIATADHVYDLEVPRAATLLASKPSRSGATSGASGAN